MSWTEGLAVGPAGSTSILAACDYAFDRLTHYGISVPPGSRFALARAAVQAAHDGPDRLPPADVLSEATRGIFELYWIMRSLGGRNKRLPQALKSDLLEILTGPQLPRDETSQNSRPRNLQFQLFVGAWLSAGGIKVVAAEPDLIIEYFGVPAGVAAKRVFSRRKFIANVKKAVRQIEASKMPGLVAVNVDRLIDTLTLSPSDDVTAQFDSQVTELARAHELVVDNESVIGMLVIGMHVTWEPVRERPRVTMSHLCHWRMIPRGGTNAQDIDDFFARFQQRQGARMTNF